MEQQGRRFEFGYPHFHERVSYSWPDKNMDYSARFMEKRDELEKILLGRLRGHIEGFNIRTHVPSYPHLQKGMKGLTLYLGDDERWIEIWQMPEEHFINGHSLDAWNERAACFNIGSDVLEHLDPSILAPRVENKEGRYVLRYPIPAGQGLITSPLFDRANLQRIYKIVGLDENIRIIQNSKSQTIQNIENPNGNGIIIIQDRICEGRDFERGDIPKASWVISQIMSMYPKAKR